MVVALTLGFVMFLNIVARIPFTKDFHDALRYKGYSNVKIGRMNLPTAEIEAFLMKNDHMIEDIGLITN